MPNIIDLFAGAGGLTLGAYRAGFSVLAAFELDKHAIDTHKKNFPQTSHIQIDVTKLTCEEIHNFTHGEKIDGVIGGPPCQGFSNIGHGDVNDVRNKLFVRFFEIVRGLNPSFFLAENVPGILQEKYNFIREEAFSCVQNYAMLPPMEIVANEYGAPTTRKRIFFIGYLPNKINRYTLTTNDFALQKLPESQQIHVKDALKGLPVRLDYQRFKNGTYVIKKNIMTQMRALNDPFYNRAIGEIPLGVGDPTTVQAYCKKRIVTGLYPTQHSEAVIARYSALKNGKQDAVSKSYKLKEDGFCPTLRSGTGPEKGSYQAVRPIHYSEPRVITPREAARLQGFPDWFLLPNTIWHSFRQIGNSVSPIVAEQILSVIIAKL